MSNTGDFEKKLKDYVAGGFVSLSLALGQELGLFDHVTSRPQTAPEIAASAGCKERYILEWLKCLAVAGVIETSENGRSFWIPEENRKYFSKTNPTMILSAGVPSLAEAFYHVKDCLNKDGPLGVSYSKYPNYMRCLRNMTDTFQSGDHYISGILSTIPNAVERLGKGGRFLDIGCGPGHPSFAVAQAFPESESYGIDFLQDNIDFGKQRAKAANLKNLHYLLEDAANLPQAWSDTFDVVAMYGAIHDQFYPEKSMAEAFRVLKNGCHLSVMESNTSGNVSENKWTPYLASFVYAASLYHCMPVASQVEGAAGMGTVAGMDKFVDMAKNVGFEVISVEPLPDMDWMGAHFLFQKPN